MTVTVVNERLVELGHARVYGSRFADRPAYETAAETARAAERGVWGFPAAAVAHGVVAVDVANDRLGNDNERPNGEWVVLRNVGDRPVPMTGWTVTDRAGFEYRFPTGFRLAPNATVRLHTGRGNDSADELYWGFERAVWNNGGDDVRLSNANGTLVATGTYGAVGRLRCGAPPLATIRPNATDPDCDGLAEDVDGNGRVGFLDVVDLLFAT